MPLSLRELYEKGLDLATALIALGLQPRDHVGVIADNRLEWILSDYGILLAGAADVPRGTDVTDAELVYILAHSDSRMVFVENSALLRRVLEHRAQLPNIREIVLMTPAESVPEGVRRFEDLLSDGAARRAAGDSSALERVRSIQPSDLFTIIYTSGTTGTPKGVQLTHANMCSQIENLPLELRPGDRALSLLPVWHSYERVFEMLCVSRGVTTHYTSLRALAEDLKTVKPTVMASAPRLWENLYLKILSNVKSAPPVRQALFHLACLLLGGLGLVAVSVITQKEMLLVSMVGVGIAWASILSMPYAMLANCLPAEKMGFYMGVFNFFIVLPQIAVALGLGEILIHFPDVDSLYVVVGGDASMILAALLTLRVEAADHA